MVTSNTGGGDEPAVTRWFVFETLTGQVLHEFVPVTGSWSARVNEPETLTVTVPLTGTNVVGADWWNLATPWKHSLMVDEGGRLYGGPIQPHDYSPEEPLTITARGIRALFTKRTVLPVEAMSVPLVFGNGEPNDTLDTRVTGLDLGSIGRTLVMQACLWPGSAYPIVFEPERIGTRERTYKAIELKNIDEALAELSGVEGGPDFGFWLRWKNDTQIEWVMSSGTEAAPRLASRDVVHWDLNAHTTGTHLSVHHNPTRMGSLSWAAAGRGDDSVLIARAYDSYLVDNGVPLMEIVDSAHTQITEQSVLDGWAAAGLRTGRKPSEFWSLQASLNRTPWLRDYNVGDYCDITITADPYIPDGTYRRRILELAGNHDGQWVTITCGETFD